MEIIELSIKDREQLILEFVSNNSRISCLKRLLNKYFANIKISSTSFRNPYHI